MEPLRGRDDVCARCCRIIDALALSNGDNCFACRRRLHSRPVGWLLGIADDLLTVLCLEAGARTTSGAVLLTSFS